MRRSSTFAVALLFLLASGCGENASPERAQPETTVTEASTRECSEAPLVEEAPEGIEAPLSEIEPLAINTSEGGNVELRVEVAEGIEEQSQGLMFRGSLGEECGMLFVYDDERELSFWMRNTYVPLSIAFIDSGGRIVDIQDMEPLDDEPPSYVSAAPARYALEVNRGFFEENGVEVGDEVELPR